MSSKSSIYLTKKAIRCINKLYYNAHTEPLFIRNKILKLDDLYKFELSKFIMFACINGLLPTPILEYFTTNATIHAHHTRQRNIPHATQTFDTISERSVSHKGPKTWTEIPQSIRLLYINCWELSWFYRSVGAMHWCALAVAVCVASRVGVPGWDSCVCVSWCPVCGHVPAGCVLLSPCGVRSLCFPESVSARMDGGPSRAVLWHVYCEHHYAL